MLRSDRVYFLSPPSPGKLSALSHPTFAFIHFRAAHRWHSYWSMHAPSPLPQRRSGSSDECYSQGSQADRCAVACQIAEIIPLPGCSSFVFHPLVLHSCTWSVKTRRENV